MMDMTGLASAAGVHVVAQRRYGCPGTVQMCFTFGTSNAY